MTATVISRSTAYTADLPGLGIPPHDYIINTYNGTVLELTTYKVGGASGTTVAQVAYTYNGNGDLLTVTRT